MLEKKCKTTTKKPRTYKEQVFKYVENLTASAGQLRAAANSLFMVLYVV